MATAGIPTSSVATASTEPAAVGIYKKSILPILEDKCFECHGDGYDKGKVAFDSLESNEQILDKSLWLRVLVNTRAGLMPAERKTPLTAAEQKKLEQWIKHDVFKVDAKNPDPGRVTVRRLNRIEYRNTIRDLMGVEFASEVEFPADDTGHGFDNIGDVLTVSPMLMEKYVAAAQTIIGDAVPLAARSPAKQVVQGTTFKGAELNKGRMRLKYTEPGKITNAFETKTAGTYRVVLDFDVRGDFVFNPGKARGIVKIDGKEVLNREFTYFNEKNLTFETTHKWPVAAHEITIEVQPLVASDEKVKPTALIVNNVTVEGPIEKNLWVPTPGYARWFPREVPTDRAEQRVYAREVLQFFASQAYRRPVTDDTADRLTVLAEKTWSQKGKTFEQGVAHAMAAVLANPRFLFRFEQPAAVTGKYADVDEFSLASRLSYFLWSSMPDDELITLAARGELRKNLEPQVKRMLANDRAVQFARNFTGQWLEVRDVEGISNNSRAIFIRDAGEEATWNLLRAAWREGNEPEAKRLAELIDDLLKDKGEIELDGELRDAMQKETEYYFRHVVKNDRPITEFIDSNYTFVNEKLAGLYGIPNISGNEVRLVTLPPGSPRGGVLTQGSTLVVTSNPDRTSPVKRGLFVLANVLGTPPPPPPANVPALEASDNAVNGRDPTLRESLLVHRENPACSSCHNRMDPIGLAFENFNALGMWRDTERKQPILAPGELVTGEKFESVSELKTLLVTAHKHDFYRTLTDKMLTYATGRGTEYYDVETIDGIVQKLDRNEGKFSTLLMGVIQSAPFQKMRTEATVTVRN